MLVLALCALTASLPRSAFAAAGRRGAADEGTPTALRLAGSALGAQLELEVLDLPRSAGEKALHAAWDAVVRAERELAALAKAAVVAGGGKTPLSPDLAGLIARANSFCLWSDGASGPAGGAVYRLWEESARSGALPSPIRLEEAAASAKCARVILKAEARELELVPGTELDLRGFTRGWAVDLASRSLLEGGASQFQGHPRPGDPGCRCRPGRHRLVGLSAHPVRLREPIQPDPAPGPGDCGRRAGIRGLHGRRGTDSCPAYDLRSGRPATGVSSVAAVTTLAADAEPLAMAMSVLGANGGQIRLGSLRPKPSVLWLLGKGETAVVSSSNWSAVRRP